LPCIARLDRAVGRVRHSVVLVLGFRVGGRLGPRAGRHAPVVERVEGLRLLRRVAVLVGDGGEHVARQLEQHGVRLLVRLVAVRDDALRVDDQNSALRHTDRAVGRLVRRAVAETSVVRVEAIRKERADILEARALELLRVAPDHLACEALNQSGGRHEDGTLGQSSLRRLALLHACQT